MELRTQRLLIRPFVLGDASFILELLNDPSFIQHIGDKRVRDLAGAEEYLRQGPLSSYEQFGCGLCCVLRLEDEMRVGMAGILRRTSLEFPDLGYAFLPNYCGQGYAFEATSAVMADARDRLHLKTIAALVSAENSRSIHLLGKLGFVREGVANGGDAVDLYLARCES